MIQVQDHRHGCVLGAVDDKSVKMMLLGFCHPKPVSFRCFGIITVHQLKTYRNVQLFGSADYSFGGVIVHDIEGTDGPVAFTGCIEDDLCLRTICEHWNKTSLCKLCDKTMKKQKTNNKFETI